MKSLKNLLLGLVVVTILCMTAAPKASADWEMQRTASFSMPDSTQTTGVTFSFPVYLRSNVAINAACLGLSYDQSKLQLISVEPPAAGQVDAPSIKCGGVTSLTRFAPPKTSWNGKNLYATFNFKTVGEGSVTIAVSSKTMVMPVAHYNAENPSIWDGNQTGTTIQSVAAVVSPQPVASAPAPVAKQPAPSQTPKTAPVTLGAETGNTVAPVQAVPEAPAVSVVNTAVLDQKAAHTSTRSYLTLAYAFAIGLLASSLWVVKRRYKAAQM